MRILQLLFLASLIVIAIFVGREVDFDNLPQGGLQLHELVLILTGSVGLALGSAAVWARVAHAVTGRHFRYSLAIINTGLLLVGKYVPGKVWGVAARTLVNRRVQLSASETVSISMVEFASACLFSLFPGVLLYLAILWEMGSTVLLVLFMAGCLAFIFTLRVFAVLLKKLLGFSERFRQVMVPELGPVQGITVFLLLLLYWLFFGIGLSGLMSFVEIPVDASTCLFMLCAYLVSVTAGFVVVFAPGGLGIREATFTGLCATVASVETLLVLALCLRLWLTAFEMLLGAITVFLLGRLDHA